MSHHIGPLSGLLSVFLTIGFLALYGGWRGSKRTDLAMVFGLLAWMVHTVWVERVAAVPPDDFDEFVEHMSFQFCLAAASGLVLMGAHAFGRPLWGIWPLQAVGGGAVLAVWAWSGDAAWFDGWQKLNLLIAAAVIVLLALQLRKRTGLKAWGIFGLSVVLLLSGLAGVFRHGHIPPMISAGIYTYPAALVCLWWLLSERFSTRPVQTLISRPTADENQMERQRIAQDVHDGVGSHLVSILSSLDLQDPLQKNLALSLEQCLLDLKITVDSMQEDLHSMTDALAMLRYRLQPCLERSGSVLRWDMEPHPAMDRLPVNTVVQSLRIAQECMANVMLHARASELVLECRYQVASNSIHLSVRDNGRGFDRPRPDEALRGLGLNGMRRRAADMGASIEIASKPGHGTLVTLVIPCPDLS